MVRQVKQLLGTKYYKAANTEGNSREIKKKKKKKRIPSTQGAVKALQEQNGSPHPNYGSDTQANDASLHQEVWKDLLFIK